MGRVAYATDAGARILPVNYVLGADCVIFRTVPDGEIFRYALNSNCAFEIDETNEFFESGWSVVAVGRLQLATEGEDCRSDAVSGRLSLASLEVRQPGSRVDCSYGCRVSSVRTAVIGAGPWP